MSAIVPMRCVDFARSVWWYLSEGREYLSDYEADWLLWEKTGFPAFWMTDNPQAEMAEAISDWYHETHA